MELRNKTRQTGLILVGQQFEEQDLVISPVLFVHVIRQALKCAQVTSVEYYQRVLSVEYYQ